MDPLSPENKVSFDKTMKKFKEIGATIVDHLEPSHKFEAIIVEGDHKGDEEHIIKSYEHKLLIVNKEKGLGKRDNLAYQIVFDMSYSKNNKLKLDHLSVDCFNEEYKTKFQEEFYKLKSNDRDLSRVPIEKEKDHFHKSN